MLQSKLCILMLKQIVHLVLQSKWCVWCCKANYAFDVTKQIVHLMFQSKLCIWCFKANCVDITKEIVHLMLQSKLCIWCCKVKCYTSKLLNHLLKKMCLFALNNYCFHTHWTILSRDSNLKVCFLFRVFWVIAVFSNGKLVFNTHQWSILELVLPFTEIAYFYWNGNQSFMLLPPPH